MEVTFGELELYDTKTFICLGLGETKIVIGEENEKLTFIFDFRNSDEIDVRESLKLEFLSDTSVKLILTNWNNPVGTTLLEPFTGGELFGREFVLIFSIAKVGYNGQYRSVTLSAYLGKELARG